MGTDAGTGVRGHVGVWGGLLLCSPTVWAGSGGERRDTHTHTHTEEHTQERTRECCTYPLATYPLKSARNLFPQNYRYRYRLEIRMKSFNCHYHYCLGVRSHPFISIGFQLPSCKAFELVFQNYRYRYRLEMFSN